MDSSKISNNSQLYDSNINISQLGVEKIQEYMYLLYS